MPFSPELIGMSGPSLDADVDARWTMAYAASLGDTNPVYMDTAAGDVVAHPVFPICLEWPVNTADSDGPEHLKLTEAEKAASVHYAHDLHINRLIRAGERVTTQLKFIGLSKGNSGTVSVTRLETREATTGELLATSFQKGMHLGVALDGEGEQCEAIPELPALADLSQAEVTPVPISTGFSHIYSECAQLWNPIHTDRRIAHAMGLPDIIVHGSGMLGLAVTDIINRYADGEPSRVSRLGCRFAGMVIAPAQLKLRSQIDGDVVSFCLVDSEDQLILKDGFVKFR